MRYVITLLDLSGNHGDFDEDVKSFVDAVSIFRRWITEVGRYADESNAQAYVRHHHADYPEFALVVGPRGGVRRERT